MKTKFLLVSSFAVILVAFVTPLSGVAPQKDSQDVLPFSALTLNIAFTKDEFAPLEPIPIIFTLKNETKNPVIGHSALGLSDNHIDLFVIGTEGAVRKIEIAKPVSILVEVGRKVFQPGESYRSEDLLTVGTKDVLSQPGAYQVQAVVHGGNSYEQVKSNLLLVRISEPTGSNRRALNLIKSASSMPNLFAGYDLTEDQRALATLEALSNEFSGTVYSDYASFRVGEFYFYKENYVKAKKYLDKLADRTEFIFAKKVADYRNKLKAELSNKSGLFQ